MSNSESTSEVAERALSLAADLAQAADEGAIDILSDAELGRLFAGVLRLYAEKAQAEGSGPPFAGNITVTATDVMIGCTAMLQAVDVEVFELTLWQNMTSIKPKPAAAPGPGEGGGVQ